MRFHSKIHSPALLVKSFLGRLEKLRGGLTYEPNELLILNYHSTPKKFIPDLKEQVAFLKQHFHIITPQQLENYYDASLQTDRCSLLFTFDDGLKNNLHAAEVLNEQNIKAFFFVIPDFVETPVTDQKKFYLKNIRPVVNPHIDEAEEDFLAMSWDDLKKLVTVGHSIGAHTSSHTLVAKNSSLQNSEKEIVTCKARIESQLQAKINSFCSINNTLESVDKKEKELIQKNYQFHFTTLPGYNSPNKDPLFIKRRNVECYWPDGAFYYALGRSDLKRWQEKINFYKKL